MSVAAWESHQEYLRQSRAYLENPDAPEPDAALLTIDPREPFTGVWVGTEPGSNREAIHFTLKNAERGPRWCPPDVFALASLLLAFGGGMSINDNGSGWAYVRLWSGNDRFQLGRVTTNPQPGQVVKQSKRSDHHDQHPANFVVTGAGNSQQPAGMGSPRKTREDAIAIALGVFRRNAWRAGMAVTAADFTAVLRAAIRLVEAYFPTEPA